MFSTGEAVTHSLFCSSSLGRIYLFIVWVSDRAEQTEGMEGGVSEGGRRGRVASHEIESLPYFSWKYNYMETTLIPTSFCPVSWQYMGPSNT
jgi:hypothetical protein